MNEYTIGTKVIDPETGFTYTYVGNGEFEDEEGDVYSLAGVEELALA